jgi:voltage-gated potassium channel
MVLGYSVIAVPTGIVTAEIVETAVGAKISTRCCPECMSEGHVSEARYCRDCGKPLGEKPTSAGS